MRFRVAEEDGMSTSGGGGGLGLGSTLVPFWDMATWRIWQNSNHQYKPLTERQSCSTHSPAARGGGCGGVGLSLMGTARNRPPGSSGFSGGAHGQKQAEGDLAKGRHTNSRYHAR